MSAGAPWSVKGIDPRAREVAKDLARRSGMTLGEWLNRVILEDDVPEEVTSEAEFHARRFAEAGRVRLASVSAPERIEFTPGDLGRVAQALDRLTDRIEASETRTGLAITGIEHSVRQAVARIEAAEREGLAVVARLDGMAERLEQDPLRDAMGPRSAEALRAVYGDAGADPPAALVEQVLERLGDRLSRAEARTTEAVDGLRGALAALEGRLRAMEGGPGGDLDRRLETLANELGARVEAARAEAVQRLQASSAGGVEARLAEMTEHVRAAEQRSAGAIERMGREVLTLAEAMNRRLTAAEQQNAQAIEQVGGELVRVGGIVEQRLSRAEQAQAEALEKLGAEISRVTERLTDRVIQSERRAAQAIDDVGEQVARVTERMEHRHERLASDLSERLRESEARLDERLDQARGGLDATLAATRDRLNEAVDDAPPVHAFGPALFARAEPAPPEFTAAAVATPPGSAALTQEDHFAPLAEAEPPFVEDDGADDIEELRPLSTREVIEQARASARAEAVGGRGPQVAAERRAGQRPGARRSFPRLGFRTIARPPSTWQTALMLAGGAAFLSVGAAGVVLMEGTGAGVSPEVAMAPAPAAPRAAVALAPRAVGPTAPAAGAEIAEEPPAPARPASSADYAAAVRDIETGQAGGLAKLKVVADEGYAPAQFYLAKLYETGVSGVVKNPAEARRWTARAADGGDRAAMHNLALYYFRGEGGPQDLPAAARWFRKAAEAGVVDSQYNLGLIYQSGSGVARDYAEAYRWFTIAAESGDAQARANAVELEGKLSPAQLAALDKAAAGFRAGSEIAPQAQASRETQLGMARRILGRLGYYQNRSSDGGVAELKVAVQNFQRDHDLPATGALDPATVSQLSVFTR
jgi:localization factor PodJL